jgi:hypothetical protein
MFTITLEPRNFRWDHRPPFWASVFITSSDRIPQGAEVLTQLGMWEPGEMELVSIIGGMEFLKILGRHRFSRIHLFDANVNELIKFAAAYDYLLHTPYEQFDGFRQLGSQIRRAPERYYLPAAAEGLVSLRFDESQLDRFRLKSAVVQQDVSDFPRRAWKPSAAEYALSAAAGR